MGVFNGEVIPIVRREGKLYQMTFAVVCKADAIDLVRLCTRVGPVEFWYRRLGHLNVMGVYAL